MQVPRSIILVRLSALGDVLMFVPLVRTLQHHFPNATLTWVISRPAYDLVEGMDGVEFIVIDKPKSLRDYYQFYKQVRERNFDVLLAAQASFRANLLYPLIRARRKIGYDKKKSKDGHHWFVKECIHSGEDHTLEGFLKFGEKIGATPPQIHWNLPISAQSRNWVKENPRLQNPYLVINPAASKEERNWSVEHYISIANWVKEQWGLSVVLTGGPAQEEKKLAQIILEKAPHCYDLVGQTKPKQLLALIEQAKCVLCPDTGPSHMASSVATPVVALHAVTNAKISGPYSYLNLVVDYYPQALHQFLNTSYGDHKWGTQVHHRDAMSLIPLDEVMQRLTSIFNTL